MDSKVLEKARISMKRKRRFSDYYNKYMSWMIILFIVGYGFFFTTKMWYDDTSNMVHPTKLNSVQTWNKREIQLFDWEYCQQRKEMELQFSITNKSYDGKDTYYFTAIDSNSGYLKTETIVNENGFYVVRIKKVPDKWKEIAFFISTNEEQTEYCKLFTNKQDVARTNDLIEHTYNEYMMIRLDSEITMYNEYIETLQADIEEQKKQIDICSKDIQKYEDEKKFQTQMEQADTDMLISEIQMKISAAQSAITSDTDKIEEYNKRIALIKEERSMYE